MERFHVIQDAAAIIVTKSVFKQVPVYYRGNSLYIGAAGGFVRLYTEHRTGVPTIRWEDIDIPHVNNSALVGDGLDKLALPPAAIKAIEGKAS